ncbi:MAG TPA: hemolysin family protein [Methylocella sp.]|nr:hemolysin family protein [Methylocella sp.]
MSEHDVPTAAETAAGKPAAGGKPSLFDRLRALFGIGGASIRGDIEEVLADTSTEDDVSPQERALLKNVLALHEVHVGDVMVPRADIIAVSLQTTLADVLAVFHDAGHSRLPVQGDTLDDPRGMVHIRDFVGYLAAALKPADHPQAAAGLSAEESKGEPPATCRFGHGGLDTPLSQANILRPVLFVPASMPALDLLVKMQATRTHMALVIDEYGGTEGLASIEDIMEMIVGDIEDEHDLDESPKIETLAEGGFLVDARADLAEVSRVIAADLRAISDAEEVDTLGGLITALAGHVPVRGEIIAEDGIAFEVTDADPRRVKRVKIRMTEARRPSERSEDTPLADNPAGHPGTPAER